MKSLVAALAFLTVASLAHAQQGNPAKPWDDGPVDETCAAMTIDGRFCIQRNLREQVIMPYLVPSFTSFDCILKRHHRGQQ